MIFLLFSLFYIGIEYSLTWNKKKAFEQLSRANVLFIKTFQALNLNFEMDDLNKYSDNAPYTHSDIDVDELINLQINHGLTFDEMSPIHSGMISLVYLATRVAKPEEKVIIKIKRKHIDEIVKRDFGRIKNILWVLSFFNDRFQISFDESLLFGQLDFVKEKNNIIMMSAQASSLDYVYIPQVFEKVGDGKKVILMEYVKGIPIANISEEHYDEYARKILNYICVSILIHGRCHGDLHCGNILGIGDGDGGKIGVIDFGLVYTIENDFKRGFTNWVIDVFTKPANESAESLLISGILEPVENIKTRLTEEHKKNIIGILERILQRVFHDDKNGNVLDIILCLTSICNYIKENDLMRELDLHVHPDFIKVQLIFAMGQGIVITLCKEHHIEVINECIVKLFHLDLY